MAANGGEHSEQFKTRRSGSVCERDAAQKRKKRLSPTHDQRECAK